jgi:hypothetical protein
MNKTCTKCLIEKSIAEFYKQSKRGSMGVRGSCKLCDNSAKKAYRELNKESVAKLKKSEYERNKEHHLEQKKKYRQENKGKINHLVSLRKKIIKQRTPNWLTEIDFERIRNEYRLAELQSKVTGEPWHVDHIIPLQGKLVSGLHVPSNLQAMRGIENISKKNKFEVNYA